MLASRRAQGLLGKGISGKVEFDFDIRIQLGAGAYICGEESALISSCEGLRGDPRNRPPFPAQRGYLGMPTSVNNVETLCCVPAHPGEGLRLVRVDRIAHEHGHQVAQRLGGLHAARCLRGGARGPRLAEVLEMVRCRGPARGAGRRSERSDGGVRPTSADSRFDHLATGGAAGGLRRRRDPLQIAAQYLAVLHSTESCGFCTPCRVGRRPAQGAARPRLVRGPRRGLGPRAICGRSPRPSRPASRCGLGQASPNPVLTTLPNFLPLYEARLTTPSAGRQAGFDLGARLALRRRAGRPHPAPLARPEETRDDAATMALTVDGRGSRRSPDRRSSKPPRVPVSTSPGSAG